jgi:hypothetical protein
MKIVVLRDHTEVLDGRRRDLERVKAESDRLVIAPVKEKHLVLVIPNVEDMSASLVIMEDIVVVEAIWRAVETVSLVRAVLEEVVVVEALDMVLEVVVWAVLNPLEAVTMRLEEI